MRVEGLRWPVINACRVDADRIDAAVRDEPAGRVRVDAGEVQVGCAFRACFQRAQIPFAIAPALAPAGSEEDDRSRWYLPVQPFPGFQYVDGNQVVGVLRS